MFFNIFHIKMIPNNKYKILNILIEIEQNERQNRPDRHENN